MRSGNMRSGTKDLKYVEKVRAIDERGEGLTRWEIDFIAAMIDSGTEIFSDKMKSKIDDLYMEKVK